ncbi:MAG: universal stress protein [Phycisphaerae bacterium]|jgi:nucleotide-binding universal stress UspA family protein
MLRHILIPLDGAKASESVLPTAVALARRAGASVTLLHVLETKAPGSVHGERHLVDQTEAEQYLQNLVATFPPDVPACWHVHAPVRHLADSLASHAEDFTADLILMCSHGHVRLRDRFVGNLGQRLASEQPAPVLLLKTPGAPQAAFPFRRLLAALDGQVEHEACLAPAAELARLCQAPLTLLGVVATMASLQNGQLASSTYLPGATAEILELQVRQLDEYLRRLAETLTAQDIQAETMVARGDPARQIISAAQARQADVIVLATHGHAGTAAFWAGSVAAKIIHHTDASVLLVPAPPSG